MTHKSKDLALAIINTGEGYQERISAGRIANSAWNLSAHHIAAVEFLRIASNGARRYAKEFSEEIEEQPFTAAEILLAAAELADYYAEHAKEIDAAEKAQRA